MHTDMRMGPTTSQLVAATCFSLFAHRTATPPTPPPPPQTPGQFGATSQPVGSVTNPDQAFPCATHIACQVGVVHQPLGQRQRQAPRALAGLCARRSAQHDDVVACGRSALRMRHTARWVDAPGSGVGAAASSSRCGQRPPRHAVRAGRSGMLKTRLPVAWMLKLGSLQLEAETGPMAGC
jgi:hypothetical protein